jgi:hypothetical protein
MSELYLALVHHPVLNKNGDEVTSSISNLDIHDIARAARTYGVKAYWIVHPDPAQSELLARIMEFWSGNPELPYNPQRSEAMQLVAHASAIEEIVTEITTQEGMRPLIVTTTANTYSHQISFRYLKNLQDTKTPLLLIFGTGYGLCPEVHDAADYVLQPIQGCGAYNHLSVRSAVAIVLDRLRSEYIYGRNHGYSAPSWQRPNQNRLSRVSRWRHREGPL